MKDAQRLSGVGSFHYDALKDESWWSDELFNLYGISPVNKLFTRVEASRLILPEAAIINTDKYKLDNILTNLINNAIKFTASGYFEFGNYILGDALVFFVKDSGRGIPGKMHKTIFDRFVQADMELTRDFEGSGLGLSIVKAYVEELGGKIEVQSSLGKGSTFSFSIPYIKCSDQTVPSYVKVPKSARKAVMKNTTILVAEDDELSFSLLQIILSKENFKLIHTRNGEDTVRALQENPSISLILMDIQMPGMDGLEATRKIRHFNKTIPITAQSAHYFHNERENAIKKGCNNFITKPINRDDLLALIQNYTRTPN